MDLFLSVSVFFLKVIIIVTGILVIIGFFFAMIQKSKEKSPKIKVNHVNKKWKERLQAINSRILSKKEVKKLKKQQKAKQKDKKDKKNKTIYVLSFKGDVKASQVKNLRQEVSVLLELADKKKDEVVIRVESPGGTVMGYGLAASQLMRLKEAGLKLIACVDKIAASGGYMMACTADHIVAAPFSIIGSIGVVSSFPNFHRFLKGKNVDYLQITAGEYKRTITVLGEITDKAKLKHQEQIENIHTLFKNFVFKNRQKLNLSQVATGEYWLGSDALNLNLVDEIKTSDEYLFSKRNEAEIYEISIDDLDKKNFLKKLMEAGLFYDRNFFEFYGLKNSKRENIKDHKTSPHPYEDLMFL